MQSPIHMCQHVVLVFVMNVKRFLAVVTLELGLDFGDWIFLTVYSHVPNELHLERIGLVTDRTLVYR
jgi:hypothetical protein